MRILIDTNIIIYREDNSELDVAVKELFNLIYKNNIQLLVHPYSLKDISKDTDEKRKSITLSKIATYAQLESPPNPNNDKSFREIIIESHNSNDQIDDYLLYAVYRDAVSFLITNDNKLLDKSIRLNISDRVFNISEAINYINYFFNEIKVQTAPPVLKEVPLHNISLDDPLFDALKIDYDFENWYKKKSAEGKKAWVYYNDNGSLGAFLLLKEEVESITDCTPILPNKNRLKISTLKVTSTGYKIGELFIKIAIEYAIKKQIDELYLTHFDVEDDPLLPLIHNYGFENIAIKNNNEKIYTKRLKPPENEKDQKQILKFYYPSFFDGTNVRKFIVPIKSYYHNLLFQDSQHSEKSLFHLSEFVIEANTIQKAYLCHSNIKKIQMGDILLFYLSQTSRSITSLGIVDKIYYDINNADEIMKYVGKRTVYNKTEIEKNAKKETLVILFRWHFYFNDLLTYDYLINEGILQGPPQSILEIDHTDYIKIKSKGGIPHDFTIN